MALIKSLQAVTEGKVRNSLGEQQERADVTSVEPGFSSRPCRHQWPSTATGRTLLVRLIQGVWFMMREGTKVLLVFPPPETRKCAMLQIFVEIERARLTRRLATIKEAEGNIAEAADTLQEVPVVSQWCWRAVAQV